MPMPKPLFRSDIPVQSLLAVTQTALSCGIGMLLASKLQRDARRNAALAMISIGALSTLPLVFEAISRRWRGPATERGMRRTLESIRDDSGISDDADFI